MKNIWLTFRNDLRSLRRSFFACAVIVGIVLLPSLYAWLNIFSNWDPYGNTGGISIAVASLDEGYIDDGTYYNKGQDVVDDLRESTAINWVIVDSENQAVNGVKSGDYYAAVVIDKDFSRKMFRMLTDWTGKPAITYYENAKKNAVATKITDTAVETLKSSISSTYLEVVINSIMTESNLLADNLTADDPEAAVRGILYQAKDLLNATQRMMNAFEAAGDTIPNNKADAAALEAALADFNTNLPSSAELEASAAELQRTLYTLAERTDRALDAWEKANAAAPEQESARETALNTAKELRDMADRLNTLAGSMDAGDMQTQLRNLADQCDSLAANLELLATTGETQQLLDDCDTMTKSLRTMADRLPVTAKAINKDLETVMTDLSTTLAGVKELSEDAQAVRDAVSDTSQSLDTTMALVRPATERMLDNLSDTIDKLQGMDDEDGYLDILIQILGGDPVAYGEYFPEMVQTTVNKIYPVENYGSAMTPFYTVLAIWVGSVMLSAIVKVHARTEGLVNPTPAELYFGRYLLFFVLSQLQAAIIVFGDLHILKIQCLHPSLLYLTASLTAFTFSLLIYSMALSFGDVGKAIVVVVMVMQIAGSSGTFPIELLPEIYQKFYRFFPFPYAIDAMRECICGLYETYYIQQIMFLLLFAVAALLIGLLVRRPFIGLNEFMEEKLEETELL